MLMLLLPHWEGIQCRGKCRYTGCIIWSKQDLSPSPHPESNNIIIAIVLIEVRWRASWLPSQHLYPVCLFSLAPLKAHGLIDWPTWISIIPQLRTMSMGKMFAYCFWERSIIIKWDLPKALDEADIHHVKHGRGMKRNQFLETWFNCWIKLSLKSILSRFSWVLWSEYQRPEMKVLAGLWEAHGENLPPSSFSLLTEFRSFGLLLRPLFLANFWLRGCSQLLETVLSY